FCWSEQRGLSAGQENGRHLNIQVVPGQAKSDKHNHCHLKQLGGNGDGPFAVAISKVTAGHGKQYERQREQCAHHQHHAITLCIREAHAEDKKDDEVLEAVLVEGALKLGGNQAPIAALPAGLCLWLRVAGFRHRFSADECTPETPVIDHSRPVGNRVTNVIGRLLRAASPNTKTKTFETRRKRSKRRKDSGGPYWHLQRAAGSLRLSGECGCGMHRAFAEGSRIQTE